MKYSASTMLHYYFMFLILVLFLQSPAFSQCKILDIHTENQYYNSLDTADNETFIRKFEYPFAVILSDSDKSVYSQLSSLKEKKSFITSYWREMNPNPLKGKNDWLLQFIHRLQYIDSHFASRNPPFFDERGTYYLKYGKPSQRYVDSGGQKTMRLFKDRTFYQYLSSLYNGFPPLIYYSVYPNESWVYQNIDRDYVIHFVKEGEDYHVVNSLLKALKTSISKNSAWYWSEMIQRRAHLSQFLTETANNLLQHETELMMAAYTGQSKIVRGGDAIPHKIILQQQSIYEARESNGRQNMPVSVFYSDNEKQLDFFADITQFRAPHDSTRIDVTFITPFKDNIVYDDSLLSKDTLYVSYSGLLRNKAFQSIAFSQDWLHFPVKYYVSDQVPNAVRQLSFTVLPQKADITLQIQELLAHHAGVIKHPLKIKNFAVDSLQLSDVQFWTKLQDESQNRVFPSAQKLGGYFIPYPDIYIQKSLPLYLYFEIYNLNKITSSQEYSLTMRVTKQKRKGFFKKMIGLILPSKEESISISQKNPIVNDVQPEFLSIDIGKLGKGDYNMEIMVRDPVNPDLSAKISKDIEIRE